MNLQYKKAPVTYGLIGVCVLVFMYSYITYGSQLRVNDLLEMGGLQTVYVVRLREYYRLLTANIIHADLMHLFGNCYSLYVIGDAIGLEGLLKTKRYAFLVLCAALTTTLIPCLLYVLFDTAANSVMVGISGVVFGLLGGMMVLALRFKGAYMRVFQQIKSSLLLMVIISFIVPSISWLGHLSGFIGGVIGMVILITCFPVTAWKKRNDEKEILH